MFRFVKKSLLCSVVSFLGIIIFTATVQQTRNTLTTTSQSIFIVHAFDLHTSLSAKRVHLRNVHHHRYKSTAFLLHPQQRSSPLYVSRSKLDPNNVDNDLSVRATRTTNTFDIKNILFPPSNSPLEPDRPSSSLSSATTNIAGTSQVELNNVNNTPNYLIPIGVTIVGGVIALILSMGYTIDDVIHIVQQIRNHPQDVFNDSVTLIQNMGPIGILYFGIIYVVAEVLAIPAIPLTVSAGYLFGLPVGIGIVLLSATIAASISFLIGKTILRSYVTENILSQNVKLQKIDRMIQERGFPLLLLLRLSPLFPFALSNYIYGASSIDFVSYFWATLFGFAPGTIAYVYTGMVGKEILDISSNNGNAGITTDQPWYVYGIGFTVLLGIMKVISDNASEMLKSIDDDA